MDIILISSGAAPPWSGQLARRTARELASAGHGVRWLCSTSSGEEPPAIDGVDSCTVPGKPVLWRRVQSRIEDPDMEMLLATELRRALPDAVHVIGFGAAGSPSLLWIARRMGVPPMVTLRARELLCHRQSLVDEQGRECRAWEDVQRCVDCCLTPSPQGLTRSQSRLGRLLQHFSGWSPYPNRHAFLNRLEICLGGVEQAEGILVGTEEDRRLLDLAGVSAPVRVVDLQSEHGLTLTDLYLGAELVDGVQTTGQKPPT